MAKFSLRREDDSEEYDSEGPSRPRSKKQRTARSQAQASEAEEVVEGQEEVESEHEDGEEEEVEDDDVDRDQGEETGVEGESPKGDGSISVTLADPDVLDCPVCFDPLTIPVYQCENGHIACHSCCIKLGNKCPSCSWPIGYNRCRAIEKVLESVKISCRHMKYGCGETMSYSKKYDHEEICVYAPCSCPLPDCEFMGSSKDIYVHVAVKHFDSTKNFSFNCLFPISLRIDQKYLILKEQNDGTVFILNNGVELLGNVVNVCCIGPSLLKRRFLYELIARNRDTSVRLESFTESIPRWVDRPPTKGFLVVPVDFIGSHGQLKLELCIRRHHQFDA